MKMTEMRKKLLFAAFAAVDFFAAMEITAFIVAAPKVSSFFQMGSESIAWILNSYLYVVFATLVLFYFLSKKIKHTANVKALLLVGLGLFFAGSLLGGFSSSIEMFYFARVIQGIGAAVSFIGQLWVMTYSFKDEIEKPLFWTETGAALGVIMGPFLGGIFSDISAKGWRFIFDLNALIVFVAMLLVFFLYHSKPQEVAISQKGFRKDFYFAMAIIIVTISVAVASEFVVSIFLQQFKNYSGVGAGLVLLSGSFGLIFGSAFAVKLKTKKKQQIIKGIWGLLGAIVFMGVTLSWGLISLSPVSFFLVGFFYGFLGVVLYAYIAHMLPQNLLVKGVTIYLIALQLGNAVGIYTERVWSFFGNSFFIFTLVLVALIFIAFSFAAQLARLENINGDLYEKAPLRKTFFRYASNIGAESANLLQALFFIFIILPFKYFFNIKVYGLEDVEIEDQMFFISNHGARLDAWIILSGLGLRNYLKLHPFRIPIAKAVYDFPLLGFLFAGTGMYKIESKGDLDKSLEDTFFHIDNGHSIVFFPEGRMLKKGELVDPKKGIGHIIKNKKIKIVPVKIIYQTHNRKNRGFNVDGGDFSGNNLFFFSNMFSSRSEADQAGKS